MSPNPCLKKLGFSNNDRAVIFHADDVGMSQASVEAYIDLVDIGLISSAATMVPCPWFPAIARFCRERSNDPGIDIGVHLTLTSEWDHFRWGPVSDADTDTGMLDEEGYFFRDNDPFQEGADLPAVQREVVAQINRALSAGIDVTHIDSHMASLFHAKFLRMYLSLAKIYRVPALMLRPDALSLHAEQFVDSRLFHAFMDQLHELEAEGYPLLDSIEIMSLDSDENRLQQATERLASLPIGISYFIVHPAKDTPKLRAYTPDWACRVADYELFKSDAWGKVIEDSGVKVIGWRALQDCMPAQWNKI
jgi:hypothetical protein